MGNVDTKLNFRKAIVQLGTKDRVSLLRPHDEHETYFQFCSETANLLMICTHTINDVYYLRFLPIYT